MKRRRRRKCRHCGELFHPDPRNGHHQQYCSKPACRQASKVASQQRWLAKPANRDYFRGPTHVERVQAWRVAHPGYGRRSAPQPPLALQDDCVTQAIESTEKTAPLAEPALQDLLVAQPFVLIGLIANLTGSALQDDIARTGRRLQQLGRDILAGGIDDEQTTPLPRAGPSGPVSIQLDRSASGPP